MIQQIEQRRTPEHGAYVRRREDKPEPPASNNNNDSFRSGVGYVTGAVKAVACGLTGAAAGAAEGLVHAVKPSDTKAAALWGVTFTGVLATTGFLVGGPIGAVVTTAIGATTWCLSKDADNRNVSTHVRNQCDERLPDATKNAESGFARKATEAIGGFLIGLVDGGIQNAKAGWNSGQKAGTDFVDNSKRR